LGRSARLGQDTGEYRTSRGKLSFTASGPGAALRNPQKAIFRKFKK